MASIKGRKAPSVEKVKLKNWKGTGEEPKNMGVLQERTTEQNRNSKMEMARHQTGKADPQTLPARPSPLGKL